MDWYRWKFECLVVGRPVISEGYGESLEAAERDVIGTLEGVYEMDAEDIEIESAEYEGPISEAEKRGAQQALRQRAR